MTDHGLYCLGVIPARGGSQGLPGKNLTEVGSKSLLRRAVEAATASGRCTRVICSTDSDTIAAEAVLAGADVPFRRPAALASATAPTLDVVIHAIEYIENALGKPIDLVCLCEPTTPLRSAADVRGVVDMLTQSDPPADSAVSVCEVHDAHPAWLRKISDGLLGPYFPDLPEPTRRQDLATHPTPYRRNGAVYVVRRNVVIERRSLYGDRCLAYVMGPERSVNIDTELDLLCAQAIWEHQR